MKKAVLIHGFNGDPKEGWKPWLKDELEKNGFQVIVPSMPSPSKPKLDEWIQTLSKTIGNPSEDLYLVGHSLGCATILRYLEQLQDKQKIGGAIFVAGFTSNLGICDLSNFFQNCFKWEKIKSGANSFAALHSSNDPFVSIHYTEFFRDYLDSSILIEQDKGHFFETDGVTELPSVLEILLLNTAED
ncbi:alpha/beta fold hydrolase [Sphingobacterium sp. DR205]|uniref:RBBP9/YdeN family alpha/beta hydrolase n=1 Tax=Sphingobacterium sp. DR205 TaxID=2713573 RepID=UPI0013E462A3|nr:alpha/beta fold hydrolase [Sphingobacterium sp. DR205]QIH34555.1 serine hydrolase family protein [Sphingobacterium sp. DR205]